jgi:2-succinyl-6-hydroxy-2,4-cyclohexadiene-1-carboxylate synthase
MIVFIHGFLGTKEDWQTVCSYLKMPTKLIELPGHGSTPIDVDIYDELKTLPPFHLVGYSMGGRVALNYPGKTLSLSLISTHPGLKTEEERILRLRSDLAFSIEMLKKPFDEIIERWYQQPLLSTYPQEWVQKRMQQKHSNISSAILKYSLGKYPYNPLRKCFSFVGEKDEKYRRLYKDIPHKIIPGVGHSMHIENPKIVAQYLSENF